MEQKVKKKRLIRKGEDGAFLKTYKKVVEAFKQSKEYANPVISMNKVFQIVKNPNKQNQRHMIVPSPRYEIYKDGKKI